MFILFLKSSSSSLMNCSRMSFKNLYESSSSGIGILIRQRLTSLMIVAATAPSLKATRYQTYDKIQKYSATIVLSHVAHLFFARSLDIFQRRILHHLDQSAAQHMRYTSFMKMNYDNFYFRGIFLDFQFSAQILFCARFLLLKK